MMPVLVICSWEYGGLIKMKRWITKSFYVLALTITAYYVNQMSFLLMPVLIVTLLWWLINSFWIINFPVGRTIGKNKLLPNVSPGKTVEGAVGGILFSFGAMLIYVRFGLENADFTQYFFYGVLSLVTAYASILGDLFESLHKRIAGVKDSGVLVPGHGGLFDRIDSLTASAPIFLLAYSSLA